MLVSCVFFFFNDTATTEIYTLSLHDALPIWEGGAIATVTAIGLADDSVSAVRVRMDFMQDDELGWQLVWVGSQQQCGRGRNPDVWTTTPCP